MRVVLPVGFVAVFMVVVKLAWAEVHEAITRSTQNSPYVQPPAPAPRPPAAEPADARVFEPGEVLPPPAHPPRRTQYLDPRTPPPKTHVHPAERVMNAP